MTDTLINQLQSQLDKLVSERYTIIENAYATIRQANRDFDEKAIPIMRRLNQLRPPEEVTPQPRKTPHKHTEPNLEGLTDEEQQHYRELLAKKKG